MQTELAFYVKSMSKIFRVRHIATSDAEANEYSAKHPNVGVIAEDTEKGLIFLADTYPMKVNSSVLPE